MSLSWLPGSLPRWFNAFLQRPAQPTRAAVQTVKRMASALIPTVFLLSLISGGSYLLAFTLEPLAWLPQASEAHQILGILLGAQAAIAALTLAVTLFVMQGVSARSDVDDRIYVEYVRRSRVRLIFWSSVGSVAITGAVLMTETFAGDTGPITLVAPGIPNLALLAAAAFVANLVCAGLLFEQAIRLAKPDHWRNLRLAVNKRDVREAVRVFIGRHRRAIAAHENNEPDLTVMLPDPGEGSADAAIRGLLDDARRAMIERRQIEFKSSLGSITELVTYAMDEMENASIPWSEPGAQPEWPPLRELTRNLFSFREEVIREGNRECVFELLSLDYWFVQNGLARACGELFSSGLNGYRMNHQIAVRLGAEGFQDTLRDELSQNLNGLVFRQEPEKLFPFLREINRHQERVLSDALHSNRPGDYAKLREGISSASSNILRHWRMEWSESAEVARLWNSLARQYRIALMGLAGRAAILGGTDRVPDAAPYLAVARETYSDTRRLASDISVALMIQPGSAFSQWADWELEDAPNGEPVAVSTEKYPLTFFAVRIMELLEGPNANLNLRGDAQRILAWFLANAERWQHVVQLSPGTTIERQHQLAETALREAVRRDELEEDDETIRREISADRVAEFAADIRASAATSNYVERVFKDAGAFELVACGGRAQIAERRFARLIGKRFFVDPADHDKAGYILMGGDQQGHNVSFDAVRLLCEALEEAPETTAQLNSKHDLLQAIDMAVHDLGRADDLAVVLAGRWGNISAALDAGDAEDYVQAWRLDEDTRLGDMGTYRGYPILRGPESGDRRLLVFEPGKWANLERMPYPGGNDIRIDIHTITPERARELVRKYPENFPQEHDDDSKLRKWQTFVEVIICIRQAFAVSDPSRARKITRE